MNYKIQLIYCLKYTHKSTAVRTQLVKGLFDRLATRCEILASIDLLVIFNFTRHNEPGAITFGWNTPRVFGDGNIQEYQLQVGFQMVLR